MRRRSGFTLVELLVVIGIIAVLIAILLPALTRVRAQAKLTACLSNQRTLVQALYLYASEWNGWMPRDGFSKWPSGFYAPYAALVLKLTPEADWSMTELDGRPGARIHLDIDYCYQWLKQIPLFHCPAVEDDVYVLGYIVNSRDFVKSAPFSNGGETQWSKISTVKSPASVGYLFEPNYTTLDPYKLGSYNVWHPEDLPFYTPPHTNAGQPITSGYMRMIRHDDRRHLGKTTIGFFDGHAEIRSLTPGDIPRGVLDPYAN